MTGGHKTDTPTDTTHPPPGHGFVVDSGTRLGRLKTHCDRECERLQNRPEDDVRLITVGRAVAYTDGFCDVCCK